MKTRTCLQQKRREEKDGTSSDDESVHYHDDQYDCCFCRIVRAEHDDPFDPSGGSDKEAVKIEGNEVIVWDIQ